MIKPRFHHVNLKTTRLQEMIDWYGVVIGATVNLQSTDVDLTGRSDRRPAS